MLIPQKVQLQKNEEALPDAKEFDQLKEHYEKYLRVNTAPSLPSSFLSFSNTSAAFSKYMGSHTDASSQQGKIDDIKEYEPSVKIPDDDLKLLDSMITLRNIDKGTAFIIRRTVCLSFNSLNINTKINSTSWPTLWVRENTSTAYSSRDQTVQKMS